MKKTSVLGVILTILTSLNITYAADTAQERTNVQKDRMKAPHITQSWPNTDTFRTDHTPPLVLASLPVRTDIKGAIVLGMTHMNNLYDQDHNDEPFFYANCMADGTGKLFHSVAIGIPHVVGRCLLGCMAGELATGIPFPKDGLAILERYCKSTFDNPDNLNSYFDPEKDNARFIEFHNMREGLYSLWALIVAGRDPVWARNKAHAMLQTLDNITDEEGRWSEERLTQLGMKDRCLGVSIPNATRMVEPLLAYYDYTHDSLAMKLAGLYAHRGLATLFTPDGHFTPMPQSSGHVHSITSALGGITTYAAKTDDREMLETCRRIMETGIPDYFSSWGWGDEVFPDHPANVISRGEINQTGDVIRTALTLADAGYPQFYEMAERYLRSMLLPTQHYESELRNYLKDKESPADDSERNVLTRTIGGYAMQLPNDRMRKGDWPLSTLDITSGAVHALSECYRHCTEVHDGVCSVNLLFDCDNEHVLVRSGLPFDGYLHFSVRKPLKNLRVAIPTWADSATLHVTTNGKPCQTFPKLGYIELGSLNTGDEAILTFDIPCRQEKETVDGIEYTTTWIGSQIIEILPRGEVSPLPF